MMPKTNTSHYGKKSFDGWNGPKRLGLQLLLSIGLILSLSGCKSTAQLTETSQRDEYLFANQNVKERYMKAYAKTVSLFETRPTEIDVPTRYGSAHLLTSGDKNAPPLFLLHGMDASSTMWYPNMPFWSKQNRVYAVDYIMDVGKSKLRSKPLSKQEIVLFYTDIMDNLKIRNASFLGTSRGGWLAAWIASRVPDRVNKLVLLSPAQVCGMVSPKIVPAIMFKLFPTKRRLASTLKVFANHPERIDPAYVDQFYIASRYGKSKSQIFNMLPLNKKQLASLKMPVLYLAGTRDVMNSPKAIEKARTRIPNVQIEIVEDSGHFMSTDQKDSVNLIIARFLTSPATLSQKATAIGPLPRR